MFGTVANLPKGELIDEARFLRCHPCACPKIKEWASNTASQLASDEGRQLEISPDILIEFASILVSASPLSLGIRSALERRDIVETIVAIRPRDELAPVPIAQDPAYVFARDPGHRRKITLADLVAD